MKPLKTCFYWFSRRFSWFSLVFFGICGFLRFVWFNKNLRENQKHQKYIISKGGHETFKNFVFFGFPEGCFCFLWYFGFLEGFLCFLWYLRFSRRFVWFDKKTFGKTAKTNPYPRVGMKPLTTLFFWFSRRCLFVFFGFLWYLRFSRRFVCFGENLRENRKNKPISKGGYETFKNLFFLVFPNVFLVFFGFLLYWCFSRSFFKVVSMLRF